MSNRVAACCGAGCWALAAVAATQSVTIDNKTWGKISLRIFILSRLRRWLLSIIQLWTCCRTALRTAAHQPPAGCSELNSPRDWGLRSGIFWMVKRCRRLAGGQGRLKLFAETAGASPARVRYVQALEVEIMVRRRAGAPAVPSKSLEPRRLKACLSAFPGSPIPSHHRSQSAELYPLVQRRNHPSKE